MLRALITDLIVSNGPRDIASQSQKFKQHGRRHFVVFQPHFHVNLKSQTQSGKIMKN